MSELLRELARAIANSGAHDLAVDWLRNVPGLPPIMQTLHLLSIAVVLGSIVVLDLRVLGWAVPSQSPAEMSRRLAPWTWSALPVLLVSGAIFVLARPQRYFSNPLFGIKLGLLVPALALTAALYSLTRRTTPHSGLARLLAVVSLLAWFGVILAGRWIAYVDYLFPPE
jgi:putative copper export protein